MAQKLHPKDMYNAVSAAWPVNACFIGMTDPPAEGYHIKAPFGGVLCMAKSSITTLVERRECVEIVLVLFSFVVFVM